MKYTFDEILDMVNDLQYPEEDYQGMIFSGQTVKSSRHLAYLCFKKQFKY